MEGQDFVQESGFSPRLEMRTESESFPCIYRVNLMEEKSPCRPRGLRIRSQTDVYPLGSAEDLL